MEEKELQSTAIATVKEANITISNDSDYDKARDVLKAVNENIKTVKAYWEEPKQQAKKAHDTIVKKEKAMLKDLEAAKKYLKDIMANYVTEKERIAREEEQRMKKLLEEERQKAMAMAEQAETDEELEEALANAQVAEEMKVAVKATQSQNKGVLTDYEVIITDAEKVPVSVLGVEIRPIDVMAVKKLAKSSKGQIQIPGIAIKEIKKVRA